MNKKIIIPLLLNTCFSYSANFDKVWHEMQRNYISMCKEFEQNIQTSVRKQIYHPQWQKFSSQIKNLIMGKPNQRYLQYPAITATMVRTGMNIGQSFEICYLTQCVSDTTKQILSFYKEPSSCNLTKECKEFNCSANALGQLYYAARILEQTHEERLQTLVEFGGGYGCLAHIFKSVLPKSKVYIIDIPELLSVQYLYLKTALPNEKIYLHTLSNLDMPEEPSIHLIPIYIMPNLDLQADLFVSNFALSEVTSYVQNAVAEKNFFNAHTCYITGQLDGWGSYKFENHENLHTHIRSRYPNVICQPFHLFLASLKSYELVAQK